MSDYLELLGTSGEHNDYMGDNSVALCDYCSQYSLEKHIGEIIVQTIDVQVHNFILGAHRVHCLLLKLCTIVHLMKYIVQKY